MSRGSLWESAGVVTLVLFILISDGQAANRKLDVAYVADPVGNPLSRPSHTPAKVGSPASLVRPDRYEFYTFDETGELIKRLMTLEEIQEIIATGDGDDGHMLTIAHTDLSKPPVTFNFQPPAHVKVHTIVSNVQNVLKAEMEAQKTNPAKPSLFDTPDVSSSWSMILPAIFGNTGGSITPDSLLSSHSGPETDVISLVDDNDKSEEYPEEVIDLNEKIELKNKTENLQVLSNDEKISTDRTTTIVDRYDDDEGDIFNFASKTTDDDLPNNSSIPSSPSTFSASVSSDPLPNIPQNVPTKSSETISSTTQATTTTKVQKTTSRPVTSTTKLAQTITVTKEALSTSTEKTVEVTTKKAITSTSKPIKEPVTQKTTTIKVGTKNTVKIQPSTTTVKTVPSTQKVNLVKISSSSSPPGNLNSDQFNKTVHSSTKKPVTSQSTTMKNKQNPTTSRPETTSLKIEISSTTQKPQVLTTVKPLQEFVHKVEEPLIDIGQIMNQIANNLGSSESSLIRNNNTIQENIQTTPSNKKGIRSTIAPPLIYQSTEKSITQEGVKSTAAPTSYIDPTALKVTQNVKDLQSSTLEATATTVKNTSPDIKEEVSTVKYQTVSNVKLTTSETTKPVTKTKIESTTASSNKVTKGISTITTITKDVSGADSSSESQNNFPVTKQALYELSDSITDLISQISDNTHAPLVSMSEVSKLTSIIDNPAQIVEQTTNAINTKPTKNKNDTKTKVKEEFIKVAVKTEATSENKNEQSPASNTDGAIFSTEIIEEKKAEVTPTTYRPTTVANAQTSTTLKAQVKTTIKSTTQTPISTTKQATIKSPATTASSKPTTTTKDNKPEVVTESDAPLKISLNTESNDESEEDESTESYDYDGTTENGVTEDDEMLQMLNQVSEIFKMSSSAQMKSEEMDIPDVVSSSNKATSYKNTDPLSEQDKLVIEQHDAPTTVSNKNKRKPEEITETPEKIMPGSDKSDVKNVKTESMVIDKIKEVLKTTTSRTLENKEKEVINDQFIQIFTDNKENIDAIQKIIEKTPSSENLKEIMKSNVDKVLIDKTKDTAAEKETEIPVSNNPKDTPVVQDSTKKVAAKETVNSIKNNENKEINILSTLAPSPQEIKVTPQDVKVASQDKNDELKVKPTTEVSTESVTSPTIVKLDKIQSSTVATVTEKRKESNVATVEKEKPQSSSTMRSVDTLVEVINVNNTTSQSNETSWKLVPTVLPQNETTKANVTNIKLAGISSFQPLPYQRPYFNEDSLDKIKKPETHSISQNIDLQVNQESHGLEKTTASLSEDVYQFAEFCNELGFRYWNAVSANGIDPKRSLVVSNFAVTSMLALVFLGAKGATSDEMNEILKLDDMMTFNPHIVFKNVTESIEVSKKSGVATSAFIRELYSDREKGRLLGFYKDRAQQFYSAHVEEVNFKLIGDVIRRRTNLLVKRQTWGKIPEYLKTNNMNLKAPLAAFAANIFQTDCSSASTDGRDGEMYFVVSPTIRQRRLIPVPAVLYRNGFLAGYVPELDATVAAIGGAEQIVSTILLMPGQQGNTAQGDDILDLQKRLIESAVKDETWTKLLRSLVPRQGLELQVPRFSHRSIVNATSALQLMGLKELFSDGRADLRGLNGQSNDLYLSDMMAVNTFTICGEGFIGDQHHVESYPGEPNKVQRRLWRTPNRPLILENPPSQGAADLWEEPRDYQRAFHDPLHDTSYLSMPLHLRPRQARLPEAIQDPPRLKFDKPFMFFVRHNPTGLILHMGRYNPRLMP